MEDYEQAVFISYAWGGESEEIVNQIDQALQQRGLKGIRDKRDLGYKGSISAFMERIGQGNCVIIVISDKYLRSPNCMFELVEIAEGKQFHDRIFPIVLSDADIYDPVKRLEYVKHWEGKLAELDQAMRGVGQANLQGIREEIDQYSRIRDKVSGLTSILKDMNTLTPEMHRDSDFSEIYAGIELRKDDPRPGRSTVITEAYRKRLLEVVRRRPRSLGLEYSMWTLQRLTEHLAEETGIRVSYETVRRELAKEDIVFSRPQHTISSPDPDYQVKKRRLKTPETS